MKQSWILCMMLAAGSAAAQAPTELWNKAEDAYFAGNPNQCAELLGTLLQTDGLAHATHIQALELLASAELAMSQPGKAKETVTRLLDSSPNYRMDPELVHPQLMEIYYRSLQDRDALKVPDGIRSVAILDLGNRSVTEREAMEALSLGIADALITSLNGATDVAVVERERLDFVMKEIERGQSAGFDKDYAIRVGKLIGAQSLLMGGYTRIEDKLRIDTRLVETETGKILKTRSVEGKMKDLFKLVDKLAAHTAEDLGSVQKMEKEDASGEVEALIEYSRGLNTMNEGDLETAWKHFEKALELDPKYEKAERRLRQLQPLLAFNAASDGE